MARHKKGHKKTKHHTRRRIGAIKTGGLMDDLMELAGIGVGQMAGAMIARHATSVSPNVVGVVEVGGGLMLKRHFPGTFMNGVGFGIAGSGFMAIAHNTGVIHGIDDMCHKVFNTEIVPERPKEIQPGNSQPMPQQNIVIPQPGMHGNMDNVNGLNNYSAMSGLSNYPAMSGAGEEDWMREEFYNVRPIG